MTCPSVVRSIPTLPAATTSWLDFDADVPMTYVAYLNAYNTSKLVNEQGILQGRISQMLSPSERLWLMDNSRAATDGGWTYLVDNRHHLQPGRSLEYTMQHNEGANFLYWGGSVDWWHHSGYIVDGGNYSNWPAETIEAGFHKAAHSDFFWP